MARRSLGATFQRENKKKKYNQPLTQKTKDRVKSSGSSGSSQSSGGSSRNNYTGGTGGGGYGAQTRRQIDQGAPKRKEDSGSSYIPPQKARNNNYTGGSGAGGYGAQTRKGIDNDTFVRRSDWRKTQAQNQKEQNAQMQLQEAARRRVDSVRASADRGFRTIGEQLPGRKNYRQHNLENSFEKDLEVSEPKWHSTSRKSGYYTAGGDLTGGRQYYVKDGKDWRKTSYEDWKKQNDHDQKEEEKYRQLAATDERYKNDPRANWDDYSGLERVGDTISGTIGSKFRNIEYGLQNNNSVNHRAMASVEDAMDNLKIRAAYEKSEAAGKAMEKKLAEQRKKEKEERFKGKLKDLNAIDKEVSADEAKIQAAQHGTKGLAKFGLETLGAVTGMGVDIGIGAALGGIGAIPSMVVGAAGSSARYIDKDEHGRSKTMQALRSGGVDAAEKQMEMNKRYAAASGAIEGISEKIFALGAPMKKLVGNGLIDGDSIVRKFAGTLAKGKAGQNVVTALSNIGLSMTGEGLEEVVAGVLNPIAEKMIVDKDKDLDWGQIMSDSLHDALVGGAVGGLFGGAEVANQYKQGKAIKANVEEDTQITQGLRSDENTKAHQLAREMQEKKDRGGAVTEFDALALNESLYDAMNDEGRKQAAAERRSTEELAKEFGKDAVERHKEFPVKNEYLYRKELRDSAEKDAERKGEKVDRDAIEAQLDEETTNVEAVKHYEKTVDTASEIMQNKLQGRFAANAEEEEEEDLAGELPELNEENEKTVRAIANIAVGEADLEDYSLFSAADPVARETLQETLDVELPEGNEATREALMDLNMKNRRDALVMGINANVVDVVRQQLGEKGKNSFEKARNKHNISAENYATSFDVYKYYYNAGTRRSMDENALRFDQVPVPAYAKGVLPEKFLEDAYKAGFRSGKEEGEKTTQEVNEANVRKAVKKKKAKFTDETSEKYRGSLNKNEAAHLEHLSEVLKGLSNVWKVNIVLEDPSNLSNGFYEDGTIHINANTDDMLLATFTHEFMHRLEKLAPKEWKAYADFVAQKMNEKDPGSFDKAVDKRMRIYDRNDKTRLATRDDAVREVIADSTLALFEDKNFPKELARHDASLASKIAGIIKKIVEGIKQVAEHLKIYKRQREEFSALWKDIDTLNELSDRFMAAAEAQLENETSAQGRTQYEITEGMIPAERYEELKDKELSITNYNKNAIDSLSKEKTEALLSGKNNPARNILREFARQQKMWGRSFSRKDIDLDFIYSGNNFYESVSKQSGLSNKDKYLQFAKMLSCLDTLVDNAVLIEQHSPRKENEDGDLKQLYVFIAAFKDGKDIVPVKLVVKEFENKENSLYVTMTLDKLKEIAHYRKSLDERNQPTISVYNISELLKKVKENEGSEGQLGKYIPEQFLSGENTEKQFALREPVEQVRDLIAQHNLTEDKLLRVLKLGGFPMPSIAVTNLDHSNFGNISVLFGKETIDAGENKANKVYSADAWTPTVPQTEYEVDYNAMRRAQDQIEELTEGNDHFKQMASNEFSHYNAEQMLNRTGGLKGYIDSLMDNAGVKYAYLKSKGEDVQIEQRKVPPKYDPKDEAKYIQLLHAVDYHPEELKGTGHELINDERLKKVAADLGYELGSPSIFKGNRGFVRLVRSAYRYATEPETNELENDYNATSSAMDERIDKEDMRHWLENMLDGIVTDEGIWNGMDPFTPAGNSRSFKQLHYPVTAENIVKAMKAQGDKNVAVTHGIKPLRAELAKTFKNVDDIRKNKSRLKDLSEEELQAISDELDEVYSQILNEIYDANPKRQGDNSFFTLDSIASIMEEVAKVNIQPALIIEKYSKYGWEVPKHTASKMAALFNAVHNMPVNMFEAKPERVVGFDEIKQIILPESASKELKDALSERSIPYSEYDPNKEGARAEAVNQAAEEKDIKFSLREDSDGNELSPGQQEYFKDSKVRDDEGRLMVMYHGSPYDFSVFDRRRAKPGNLGRGFYFSNSSSHAGQYGNLYKAYLNIVDPLDATSETRDISKEQLTAFVERIAEDEDYGIENYGEYATVESVVESVWGKSDFEMMQDLNLTCVGDMVEALKVFNEVNDTSYDGIITNLETVTFDSNQAKDVNNENPTEDPDIRYSIIDDYTDNEDSFLYDAVSLSPERVDSLIREYAQPGNTKGNYSQAWIATIDPRDFLKLTVEDETLAKWQPGTKNAWGQEVRELNKEDLKNELQMPYLRIDSSESHSVIGHEGRHRMLALMRAGYTNIPVIIIDTSNKETKEKMDSMDLWAQDFGKGAVNNDADIDVSDVIPINEKHRSEIEDIYVDNTTVQFQLRESIEDYEEENERLREKIDKLRSEMKLSHGTILADNDAARIARDLLDMPGYLGNKRLNTLVKELKEIYADMAKDETMDDGILKVMDLARELANDSGEYNETIENEFKELNHYLRTTPLYIPEDRRSDITGGGKEEWNQFRKKNFGRLRLVGENYPGAQRPDEFLIELKELFPGIVNDEFASWNEYDQLNNVLRYRDSLEEGIYTYYNADDPYYGKELVDSIASLIFDHLDTAVPKKNFADRKKAEKQAAVQKTKDRYNKRIKKLTDKKNDEKRAAVEKTKEHYKELLKRIREEKNASTEEKLRRRMEKEHERNEKRKERITRRRIRASIERDAKQLSDMLLKPTDNKHLPKGYDKAVAELLSGLDFETTRTDAWIRKYGQPSERVMDLRGLREAYKDIVNSNTSEIEADEYMMMLIEALSHKVDGQRLSDLDTRTLKEVQTVVHAIRHQIANINNAFSEGLKQKISEYGEDTIAYMTDLDDQKVSGGVVGGARDFINVSNAKPVDFFDRMGSPLQTVFQEIVKGEDKHIRNIKTTIEFMEDVKELGGGKKAFEKWSGEKAVSTEFDLESGETIELTPAQVMSLYALNKREQARKHIFASGVVVAPVSRKVGNKVKKKLFGDQLMKTHVMLTYADVAKITKSMTEEQLKVADKLLSFLNNECAAWGNETSMKLNGYEKFREKNYFPIKSSEMFLNESTQEKQNAVSKLKNTGFTKAVTEFADNPIVIDDFFRVCTGHINTMSMYNAFVPAITDFERVYNYNNRSGRGIESSVKQMINKKYGDAVNKYISTLLQDLNTQYNKDQSGLSIADDLLRKWKSVKIGANARVLVQQPTAITRAQVYIDYKYLTKAMAINANPAVASKTKQRMWDTCPIAFWKHLGFAQTDVSRDMNDILMGNADSKWNEFAFGMYGFMDDVAWTRIFAAVEEETRAEHPEIEEGSEEWKEHVNERFRYIVDRTQVVDSTLHRSQIMRDKGWFARSNTSFMAEPTTQINMWLTMIKTARDQLESGDKAGVARTVTRFVQNYLISMTTLSIVASLISAMRESWTGDDDDDERMKDMSFVEKWLKIYAWDDFLSNVNIANQLPWVKDLISIFKGYEVERADLSLIDEAAKSIRKFREYFTKDGDVKYSWKKLMTDAVTDSAALLGIPAGNIERDFMAARKGFFNYMKDADYAHFKTDAFELNPEKNKSKFIDYYLNALEKGNDETAKEIKDFLDENKISQEDIDKAVSRRLNDEINKAIEEKKPEDMPKILKKYKTNYKYDSSDVSKKVRKYFNDELKSAVEKADIDKLDEVMEQQHKYGMSKEDIDSSVSYWTNRSYKTAIEKGDTKKMDAYDSLLKRTGMSKKDLYMNRGNMYIGYYDMLIYNAGSDKERHRLAREVAKMYPDMTGEKYILSFVSGTKSKYNISNWKKRKWTKAQISVLRYRS